MTKKLLSLLLALALLFSLAACGAEADYEDDLRALENLLDSALEEVEEGIEDATLDLATLPQEEPTVTNATDATLTVGEATEDNTQSSQAQEPEATTEAPTETEALIDEDGIYTSKEDVALYIHTYGKLPKNFITKNEARKLGWEGGSLEPYAPGKCIGGDYFGNYEGLLPTDRKYTECDIDTLGARSRGAKRIVFSADGLIYYTDDHYESFTLLYGEE